MHPNEFRYLIKFHYSVSCRNFNPTFQNETERQSSLEVFPQAEPSGGRVPGVRGRHSHQAGLHLTLAVPHQAPPL